MIEGNEAVKNVVSQETATKQLDVLLVFYDITKENITSEFGADAVRTIYNKLVQDIQRGRVEIVVDDAGDLKVTQNFVRNPDGVQSINYGEITAKAKQTMHNAGTNQINQMCALMGALSKTSEDAMLKLRGLDHTTMERVAQVFSIA